jgi:hypothetical protein
MTTSLLFNVTQLRSKHIPIIREIISYVMRIYDCSRCSKVLRLFPVVPFHCSVCNFILSDFIRLVMTALENPDGIHTLDISLLKSIYFHFRHFSIYNRFTTKSFFD